MQRVQIKNASNIDKYVQRGKRRGHAKKNSVVPNEIIKEKFKGFEIKEPDDAPIKRHAKKLSVFELSMGKYNLDKNPSTSQIIFK